MRIDVARGLLLVVVALLAGPVTDARQERSRQPDRETPRAIIVAPAAPASVAPTRPVPIISLSVKDADLVEVVRSLARIAGVNLVIDPGVRGTVTAELIDVRWDHALAVILKTQGLAMELDGRILTVAEPRRLMGAP
jgi:hypothetical protein